MTERELVVLLGAVRCVAATGLVAASALRLAGGVLAGGSRSGAERLLGACLLGLLLVTWPVAVLGALGRLTPQALLACAVALYLATRLGLRGTPRPPPLLPRGRRARVFALPALLVLPLLLGDLLTFVPRPPTSWDAMTYHLYLPVRWIQEGRLFHVPTVFGDNAAAFAPQNGALFFTWQLALLGGDALANGSQAIAVAMLVLALYRGGLACGASREAAALAAAAGLWSSGFRSWAYSANVDALLTACWLAGLAWLLAYIRERRRIQLLAAGLALGFAAGTKTVGLLLVAGPAGVAAAWLLATGRRRDLLLFCAAGLAAGGWWSAANFARYGNPVFPLDVALGSLRILPGAYGAAALRAGDFHLDGTRALLDLLAHAYRAPTTVLVPLGWICLVVTATAALRRGGPGAGRAALPAVAALAAALYWLACFLWVVPHNMETRFFLPAVAASWIGLSLGLQRLQQRGSRRWARGTAIAVVVVLGAARPPQRPWLAVWRTFAAAEIDLGAWLVLALLALLALASLAVVRGRGGRTAAVAAAAGLAIAALAVAQLASERARPAFLRKTKYRPWALATLPFQAGDPRGMRIAYTGANVPYLLVGPALSNRVVYANTQGAPDDGFYDFWARTRGTSATHKPGLYRGQGDPARWLANLDALGIDTLVIFALHRAERRYLRATPDGFPVEKAWAERRRDRFELLASPGAARIYRVRRP